MDTWVPVYRKINKWKYGKNCEMVGFWVKLLMKANVQNDYNSNGVLIGPGQMTTGRKSLAKEMGMSESKIERMLNKLEKSQEIEQQKFSKYRIITITNWFLYALGEQQADNKRTTSGQQADTNKKKEKKEKKEKKYIETFDFEKLYKQYPKKKGKSQGLKKCIKQIKTIVDYNNLETAIRNYAKERLDQDNQFTLHFSSFMGQWQDFVVSEIAEADKELLELMGGNE